MKSEPYKESAAWKSARELLCLIIQSTQPTNTTMDPDLREKLRRAGFSVIGSIVTGFEKGSDSEFVRFLKKARRSLEQLESLADDAHMEFQIDCASFELIIEKIDDTDIEIDQVLRQLQTPGLRACSLNETQTLTSESGGASKS